MEAVVTADAAFPAIKLLVQLAQSLVLAMLVVATARLTRRKVGLLATALALTGIMTFLVGPLAGAALAPFTDLRRPEVYAVPYGAYVLAWSYATFLETVTAVLAIGILVGRGLSANRTLAFLQFITLILLLRGTLVMQLLFSWSMRGDHLAAVTSTLQFFLQDLVLAGLAWWACRQERNMAS